MGFTPVAVRLPRDEARSVLVEKAGFAAQGAVILPRPNEYEKRFLRWGLDYALGAMTDLVPEELLIEMKPQPLATGAGDAFTEMSAQVLRADALLADGTIGLDDHRYLVSRIVAFYERPSGGASFQE